MRTKSEVRYSASQLKLLSLFKQNSPTTINSIRPQLKRVTIKQAIKAVAVLVRTGKLEPSSPTDIGSKGPLDCSFRAIA